jgi:thiamine kinase-like enzyme
VRLPELADRVVALGDGNLDNVLWDGEVCRLIDWEEYGASDLAYEVADLVEHASSRLTRSLDVEELLADLDLDEAQLARLEQYRRLFACFWLMMLLPGNGGFARNPPGSTEDQARHVLALLT